MSTYPLATSNFNRPREFVAGGEGKRAGGAAAAAARGGVSYQHAARATCSHAPARPSALHSALCPLVHCKMLSVWPSWPGQELMWRTLFRTFAPEPTSSWRSSPSKPAQSPLPFKHAPYPTLFTYSSLLVLGALGISCTDLRTCSHLPGT